MSNFDSIGIYIWDSDSYNTIIEGINFTDITYPLSLTGGSGLKIYNNNFLRNDLPIYLQHKNALIENNTFKDISGIAEIYAHSYNLVFRNNIITNSTSDGIIIDTNNNYTLIQNNTFINTTNSIFLYDYSSCCGPENIDIFGNDFIDTDTAIKSSSGDKSRIINNSFDCIGSECIDLKDSNHILFKDSVILSESDAVKVRTQYETSSNITLINVTYTGENVTGDSELIRKWYYQAYVNDTEGNDVANANVTAYNSTGNYAFNLTTNSTGHTPVFEAIEYINDGGTKTYHSLYTIYATEATAGRAIVIRNITGNLSDTITIGDLQTCGILSVGDKVYTLQNSIYYTAGDCFTVQANNVTIHLNGYTVSGNDANREVYSFGYA
jgi:hypothetical protein